MTDAFRQSTGDKIENKLTPDSHKTVGERLHDNVVGKGDQVASSLEPQHEKSASQKIVDAMTPGNSSHHAGDAHRQSLGDKVEAKVTPDSQKTLGTRISETVTGKTDEAASHVQTEHSKSTSQRAIDAVTPGNSSTTHHAHDHTATGQHKSVVDKVKDVLHVGGHTHHGEL
ncbi:hypothetical protein EMMF5_006106 [Cystobasidiomycetes sp. EMM_F5]